MTGDLDMAPAIRLRAAVALVGRFPVLAGVDLDVERGEVVLLQGPNGAGKTSVLRVCAGLMAVAAGEAEVLGHDLRSDRRALRRRIGLFGHSTSLYDDLTATENVRFAVRAAGGEPGSVEPALARVGVDGRVAQTAVGRLSAGQRRRVALASVVARAPELWLLDEPHAGLDGRSRLALDAILAEAKEGGATILLASHETEQASRLADRVVTLAGGQVHGVRSLRPAASPAGVVRDVEVEAARRAKMGPAHVA